MAIWLVFEKFENSEQSNDADNFQQLDDDVWIFGGGIIFKKNWVCDESNVEYDGDEGDDVQNYSKTFVIVPAAANADDHFYQKNYHTGYGKDVEDNISLLSEKYYSSVISDECVNNTNINNNRE